MIKIMNWFVTFLKNFEMFPKNVTHERRSSGQKVLLAHGAHVSAAHAKVLKHHTFQRKLFDGPVEPARDVALGPQSRIYQSVDRDNQTNKPNKPNSQMSMSKLPSSFNTVTITETQSDTDTRNAPKRLPVELTGANK